MAAASGNQEVDLEAIATRAHQHGRAHFRALITFLERAVAADARVGDYGPVGKECIRFRHDPTLTFNAVSVSSVSSDRRLLDSASGARQSVFDVSTTFLGLTGAVSPLPSYIVEEVLEDDEGFLRDFLDVFHHRILSLFYRVTSRYNPVTEFRSDTQDAWSKRIFSLGGVHESNQASASLPRWRMLRLMPLLARQRCTAWALEVALNDVLDDVLEGARASVEQFRGAWYPLGEEDEFKLGAQNNELGGGSVLGKYVYEYTGKFAIRFHPLSHKAYTRLQRERELRERIHATVCLLSRNPPDYDILLNLDEGAVDGLRLSSEAPPQLGVETFLGVPAGGGEVVLPAA